MVEEGSTTSRLAPIPVTIIGGFLGGKEIEKGRTPAAAA
jgi:hypothetical protein